MQMKNYFLYIVRLIIREYSLYIVTIFLYLKIMEYNIKIVLYFTELLQDFYTEK
jgi:hypothetical protein